MIKGGWREWRKGRKPRLTKFFHFPSSRVEWNTRTEIFSFALSAALIYNIFFLFHRRRRCSLCVRTFLYELEAFARLKWKARTVHSQPVLVGGLACLFIFTTTHSRSHRISSLRIALLLFDCVDILAALLFYENARTGRGEIVIYTFSCGDIARISHNCRVQRRLPCNATPSK